MKLGDKPYIKHAHGKWTVRQLISVRGIIYLAVGYSPSLVRSWHFFQLELEKARYQL